MSGLRAFLKKLNVLLQRRDKKFLLYLLLFSIFVSFIELAGISIIMPFIAVAGNFELVNEGIYHRVYTLLHFTSPVHFVMAFGALLLLFYIFRSVVNMFYFYMLARFSKGRYHVFAYRLFESYLGRDYRNFIDKTSAEINKSIIAESQNLSNALSSFLLMISEIFVVGLIYLFLLFVNWKMTLMLTFFLVLNAVFLLMTVTPRIKDSGRRREVSHRMFYNTIQKTMGNFKMVKLLGLDAEASREFRAASQALADSMIENEALSHFPRIFLELVGFGMIVLIVVYVLYKYNTDITFIMPLLSVFVVALYRLLPSANRILSSYNAIVYNIEALRIVHNELLYDIEELGDEKVSFTDAIQLHDIDFFYLPGKNVLEAVSLKIRKGDKVAFVGESGSGKSTLIDIVIGLYRPQSGSIAVDGIPVDEHHLKSYRKLFGYIPQQLFLFDGNVAQNVAMSDTYDEKRVVEVLKQAKLFDFLNDHHEGIETQVGDSGVKLSGGQKQRVAIARALYNDPEVLVLDEATSALDHETEAAIMDEIYELSTAKTLIIIAHRLSTVERCGIIYKLEVGRLSREVL
jgi:ATP-binding cassette, subfamily B, bacterial PglK